MEDGPQRPDIILWVDVTSGLIVGMHLDRPEFGPKDIAEGLARAIERPQARVPPPVSIRVADAATAAAVRARLGERTPVIVGPTPELDARASHHRELRGEFRLRAVRVEIAARGTGVAPHRRNSSNSR